MFILVLSVSYPSYRFDLLFLYFHYANAFLKELLENADSVFECGNGGSVLVFIDFEVEAVLFKNLHWSLLGKREEHLVYFTFASGKDFEFF
jgi:hypothetical protein